MSAVQIFNPIREKLEHFRNHRLAGAITFRRCGMNVQLLRLKSMRKEQKNRRPPGNVRQFQGQRPPFNVGRRKASKRPSSVILVVVGLAVGAAIGFAAFGLKDAWLSIAPAVGQRLVSADEVDLGNADSSPASSVASRGTALCIANVHDGDTIRTCDGERIRIENIDAPELPGSPKCTEPGRQGWCDYGLAENSRDELAQFLEGGPVTVSRSGTDRYGRTLATLNVNGQDAGDFLVSKGLARVWQ